MTQVRGDYTISLSIHFTRTSIKANLTPNEVRIFPYYLPIREDLRLIGICNVCDQNGDRVSKSDKICHICSKRLKGGFQLNMKNEGLSIFVYMHNTKPDWIYQLQHGIFEGTFPILNPPSSKASRQVPNFIKKNTQTPVYCVKGLSATNFAPIVSGLAEQKRLKIVFVHLQ